MECRCFRMSGEVEESCEDSISKDVKEVAEKIRKTTVEFLVPRINCPEHIVSML